MLEEYTQQLIKMKEKISTQQKLQHILDRTLFFYNQEKERFILLTSELVRSDTNLEELEKMSVTGLFHTLLKDKEKQQEEQRQTTLATKLKYDECKDSIATIELEIEFLKYRTTELGDVQEIHHALLEMMTKRLSAIPSEEIMDLDLFMKALEEVACAAQEALEALDTAHECLSQVKNWGNWTLIKDGPIPALQQYSKVDESRDCMYQARQLLRRLHQEVDELQANFDDSILISDRISTELIYDAFIDCIIKDWTNREEIQESIKHIEALQGDVYLAVNDLDEKLQETKARYEAII